MTAGNKIASLVALLLCGACISQTGNTESAISAATEASRTNGIWQSDGFGYIMHVENDAVRFFHATDDFCIETNNDGLQLADIFELHRFSDDNTMLMSSTTEPFEFKFQRISELPLACLTEHGDSFETTAAALNSFLSAHYVFFEKRRLDQDQIASDIAQAAGIASNELAFFNAITQILSRTRDAHVELSSTIDGAPVQFDADPGLIRRLIGLRAQVNSSTARAERRAFLQEFWVEGVGNNVLLGQSHVAGNDRIRYGIIEGEIGYIAIRSMGGFVSKDGSDGKTEREVLMNAMDLAIAEFDQVRARAVILDVSINSGGYEYLSRDLAGRFFDERRLTYQTYAGDAQDQTPQPIFIEPLGRSQFVGPVYLLTSSETVSAAETLVMAMRARPFVIHAGDKTRGALSTKLAKLLPNGWELTLSNQVYLDHRDSPWEADAARPDIPIEVFADRNSSDEDLLSFDFTAAHNAAIEKLIERIRDDVREAELGEIAR